MDELEESFLGDMRRINQKRLEQLPKRLDAIISDLPQKLSEDNLKSLKGTMKLPSSKEYKKAMTKMIKSSMYSGLGRASKELDELHKRYDPMFKFAKVSYTGDSRGLPEHVESYLTEYGLQITTITEQAVIDRLIEKIAELSNQGIEPVRMIEVLMDTAGAWMSESHSRTIARTEVSKMYNAGRLRRYTDEDNKGFVVALQYSSIIDTRTTKVCRHLDNKIVAIERMGIIAKYSPPNHYQCRSVWLPVTKFEEWEDNWDEEEEPQEGFEWNPLEGIN